MNRQITRTAWTTALLFSMILGGLSAMPSVADAAAKRKTAAVLDVGVTGVCRSLRAGSGGVLVTVRNLGTVPAEGGTVTGGYALGGGEFALFFDRSLGASPLQPGASAVVRFTGQEITDQGSESHPIYIFEVSLAQGDDARPDNDQISFNKFSLIRPCPLNIKPTINR